MKAIMAITATVGLLIGFNVNAAQNCEDLKGCEAKICHIEKQLDMAKQNNHTRKAEGLNKALENAKDNCSLGGLQSDLQDDIADIKDDIAEHQDDLAEAMEDHDQEKIDKYQQKIEEDQEKLTTLQAELQKLK